MDEVIQVKAHDARHGKVEFAGRIWTAEYYPARKLVAKTHFLCRGPFLLANPLRTGYSKRGDVCPLTLLCGFSCVSGIHRWMLISRITFPC